MCGGKWIWGLFFMTIGALWIAGNLGMLPVNIGDWWPLIFVFIGLSIILSKPEPPWEKLKEKCGDMDWEDVDWDEFGKGMEKFGKTMEKSFGKKKGKPKKKKKRR